MNASMDARKTLGFDHKDCAAKVFKSKSSSSVVPLMLEVLEREIKININLMFITNAR